MSLTSLSQKQRKTLFDKFEPDSFEILEGGKRSGKTTTLALRYALFVSMHKDTNHMVFGYTQTMAFKLIFECDGFGLVHYFKGGRTHKDEWGSYYGVDTPTGYKRIYYQGGGKADSFKAFKGMSLGSVLFTEIDLMHPDTITEAKSRTLASSMPVCFGDLNPPSPNHPIIKMFEAEPRLKWSHWTLKDNPVFTADRIEEIRKGYEKTPYLMKRDFLGERVMPEGLVYSVFDLQENRVGKIPDNEYKIELYFAGDGGVVDATSIHCYIITSKREKNKTIFNLYKMAEYYYSGGDTGLKKPMSIQAREIKVFIEWCIDTYGMDYSHIYIDPACLVLRQELELLGCRTDRADNNGHDKVGSQKGIMVGIERCQNLIHSRQYKLVDCPNEEYSHYYQLQEIGLYAFDLNGKPIDAHNHSLDAMRYGVNPFYKQYIKGV